MMMTGFDGLNSLLAQIDEDLDRIERQRTTLEQQAAELRVHREAVLTTMRLYTERFGTISTHEPEPELNLGLSQEESNKSRREVAHLLAERNGGVLHARQLYEAMLRANIIQPSVNALSVMHGLLRTDKAFERIGAGLYRLKDAPPLPAKRSSGPIKIISSSPALNAVLRLRQSHPGASRLDIESMLIDQGFDFGGKSPRNVVSACWMNIDRANLLHENGVDERQIELVSS